MQAVARRLAVRPQAVRRQLTNIFDATATWSQPQLVGWCVAHGMVTVADLQAVYSTAAGAAQEFRRGEVDRGPER